MIRFFRRFRRLPSSMVVVVRKAVECAVPMPIERDCVPRKVRHCRHFTCVSRMALMVLVMVVSAVVLVVEATPSRLLNSRLPFRRQNDAEMKNHRQRRRARRKRRRLPQTPRVKMQKIDNNETTRLMSRKERAQRTAAKAQQVASSSASNRLPNSRPRFSDRRKSKRIPRSAR